MTRQEMFNKAYFGVIHQGAKSVRADERCAYRGLNGLKCGVGHLIDDATAKRWDKRESSAIIEILDNKKLKVPEWMVGNKDFLSSLQWAHDEAWAENFLAEFKGDMKDVAKKYHLTVPE